MHKIASKFDPRTKRLKRRNKGGEPKVRIDERNKVYGSVLVLEFACVVISGKACWKYVCACGRTGVATGVALRQHKVRHCGECRYLIIRLLNQLRGHRGKATRAKWNRDDLTRMEKLLANL